MCVTHKEEAVQAKHSVTESGVDCTPLTTRERLRHDVSSNQNHMPRVGYVEEAYPPPVRDVEARFVTPIIFEIPCLRRSEERRFGTQRMPIREKQTNDVGLMYHGTRRDIQDVLSMCM